MSHSVYDRALLDVIRLVQYKQKTKTTEDVADVHVTKLTCRQRSELMVELYVHQNGDQLKLLCENDVHCLEKQGDDDDDDDDSNDADADDDDGVWHTEKQDDDRAVSNDVMMMRCSVESS